MILWVCILVQGYMSMQSCSQRFLVLIGLSCRWPNHNAFFKLLHIIGIISVAPSIALNLELTQHEICGTSRAGYFLMGAVSGWH